MSKPTGAKRGRPPAHSLPGVNREQLAALDSLMETVDELGHVTACQAQVRWWTTPPPEAAAPRASWVAERAALCARCPVLAQCKGLLAAGMKVDGVTAGVLYENGRVSRPRTYTRRAGTPLIRSADGIRHGTVVGYDKDGRRDDCCRLPKNAAQRASKARRRAREAS